MVYTSSRRQVMPATHQCHPSAWRGLCLATFIRVIGTGSTKWVSAFVCCYCRFGIVVEGQWGLVLFFPS